MHVSRSATCLAYRNGLRLILLIVAVDSYLNPSLNWLSITSYPVQKSVHKPSPHSRIRQLYACIDPKILFLERLIHCPLRLRFDVISDSLSSPVFTKMFNQSPFVTTIQKEKDGVVGRVQRAN